MPSSAEEENNAFPLDDLYHHNQSINQPINQSIHLLNLITILQWYTEINRKQMK